jgi:signal transduction histidine kinase
VEPEIDRWVVEQRTRSEREAAERVTQFLAPISEALKPPKQAHQKEGPSSVLPILACACVRLLALTLLDYWRSTKEPIREIVQSLEQSSEPPRLLRSGEDPLIRSLISALERGRDLVRSTQQELESAVGLKTHALGEALNEQRETTQRLERVYRELQATQEQLLEQRKMAALGTLAGGVAHEFHNILGGIGGCAEDLLRDVKEEDSIETLHVISRAAKRGRDIVDGLRRFSGEHATRPNERSEILSVMEEVQLLVQKTAERAQVLLKVTGPKGPVAEDGLGLHQVLLNLVNNAIAASSAGSVVELDLARKEKTVEVSVLDRGHGVMEEDRSHIFEPFFTTRQGTGGTGLGLAISHGIVTKMRGTLTHLDREGGGSIFRVELPLFGSETQR